MYNIFQLNSFITKNPKRLSTNSVEKVCTLYHGLIESGFSSCAAYHEAMKLLLVSNPNFELSDLSKKTFEIINPVFDNYYENGIDNHSQN